jgi:hypothetical protein
LGDIVNSLASGCFSSQSIIKAVTKIFVCLHNM